MPRSMAAVEAMTGMGAWVGIATDAADVRFGVEPPPFQSEAGNVWNRLE